MIASTTQLNRVGADLAKLPEVHAITDVTGFGLLGHGLEMARGSKVALTINWADVPLLSSAASLAQGGFVTGASGRNWASYGHEVRLPEGSPDWQRSVLTDPQTSGGLLVSCEAAAADAVLQAIVDAGFESRAPHRQRRSRSRHLGSLVETQIGPPRAERRRRISPRKICVGAVCCASGCVMR